MINKKTTLRIIAMTTKEKLPLKFVGYKTGSEGLGYAIQHYFGKHLNSEDEELNEKWLQAYNILTDIDKRLEDYYE